jgi:hypothetical protein
MTNDQVKPLPVRIAAPPEGTVNDCAGAEHAVMRIDRPADSAHEYHFGRAARSVAERPAGRGKSTADKDRPYRPAVE